MPEFARDKWWLLITTTAAADFTGGLWLWLAHPAWNSWYKINVLTALTLGQIAVIAVWLAFRQAHDVWSYIVPIVALWVAAVIRLKLSTFGGFTVVDYACRTAVQMLGTLFGLAVLRITIWRPLCFGTPAKKWEFSVRQMLVWTTMTACFLGLVSRSTWSDGQLIPLQALSGIFAPPLVAIGVVVGAICVPRWYIRIYVYTAVASAVATFVAYGRSFLLLPLNIEFILEALFIAGWVELSGIVPPRPGSRWPSLLLH